MACRSRAWSRATEHQPVPAVRVVVLGPVETDGPRFGQRRIFHAWEPVDAQVEDLVVPNPFTRVLPQPARKLVGDADVEQFAGPTPKPVHDGAVVDAYRLGMR